MPSAASSYAHTGTPSLQVSDARGLTVRSVQFHRRESGDPIDTQVTSQRFDAAGRLLGSRGPYLFELARTDPLTPFNVTQVASLSGVALLTESVDAGWRVMLTGGAGEAVERWDGRGSHSITEYDQWLRPLAMRESGRDVAEHTLERFTYADVGADAIAHNLCGQLMRHDDPAGTVHVNDLNMAGEVLKHTRRFLLQIVPPDWPMLAAERDALLETDDGAITSYQFAVAGELLEQTDALDNRQVFAYTVAGQLKDARVTLAGAGQLAKLLVSDIDYNAMGQIHSQTAGNGVVTRHHYDEADGRLSALSAHKADGTPLQFLKYRYDAVGNVLSIEDAGQPIRYFNNQRIEPTRTYRYDTLHQLIEATGCEAKTGQNGPALPDFQSLSSDPGQITNYTQTYHYDAGGNLLELVHLGAQAHGRTLTRQRYSDRCLPERNHRLLTEDELANGFDANGNLRELQPGQPLAWDLRNQLSAVQLIVRKDAQADGECYIYDGGGQRVRKVNVSQTGTRTITREVRYLPGLEIRTHGRPGEILHVITVNAGTNSVQVMHWLAGRLDEVPQDQVRYSLNDHLKSGTLELDQSADIISQEWYYPFGGTAYWAGRNTIEAQYKTVRYSGKERDATGLYYYGFRYYAPWLQRWVNPDPAGSIDGLNFYRMVRNNPVKFFDPDGLSPSDDLAMKILKHAEFYVAYAKNPIAAIRAVESIYEGNPHIARAIIKVKNAMAPTPPAIKQPEKKLKLPATDFADPKLFNIIYGTNIGSQRINTGMRTDSPIQLRGRDVVREIRKQHGDDALDKKTAKDVRFAGSSFDLEDAKSISYKYYNQSNSERKTYFRGQDITEKGLKGFHKANEKRTVLFSKSFLSVDTDKNVAMKFSGGDIPVLFEISGFSAARIHTSLSSIDEKDLVFTIHADFQVTDITYDKAANLTTIKLKELRAFTGAPTEMPY